MDKETEEDSFIEEKGVERSRDKGKGGGGGHEGEIDQENYREITDGGEGGRVRKWGNKHIQTLIGAERRETKRRRRGVSLIKRG